MIIYYSDKFKYAVSVVLNHEGGLVDDPNDYRGITNFGITIDSLAESKLLSVINNPIQYLKNLNEDQAINFYEHYIWNPNHYELIADRQIATKVFDMTVNMGKEQSHKILQRSVNLMSKDPILVDGIIGVETLKETNLLPSDYLHQELREQQTAFYKLLVKEDPTQKIFLEGWLNRAKW